MHWEPKILCDFYCNIHFIVVTFIAIFTLLWWSGTEPKISPSYACTGSPSQSN